MKLQTNIPVGKGVKPIDYNSSICLVGSCFAEHMAAKLEYYQFRHLTNPLGILFHPMAIKELFRRSLDNKNFTKEDIFSLNDLWHCYDAHSDLSGTEAEATVEKLNDALKSTHQHINKSTHFIITLGTAWVYRLQETGHIVANCHKVPQSQFDKELLTIDELEDCLGDIEHMIRNVNADIEIIWTVSPVRHLKDGFAENNRSKAHLIAAVHQIVRKSGNSYFPSYELMMDELRDYRFYDRDMVHPNEMAVDYIWEKFRESWIDPGIYPIMEKAGQIQRGLAHRPFHPGSEQHQKFRNNLDSQIRELQKEYPFMNFEVRD